MTSAIRVRMYRTGFGDCFLLSFGPAASRDHVLIDFGTHAHGDIGTMGRIMDELETETGKKLALIIATHAHRDHISGFGTFRDRFAQFEIGEVWLPWTEDPKDENAAALQRKQVALTERLHAHLAAMGARATDDPRYAPALHAISNLRGNRPAKDALAEGFRKARTRYYAGGRTIRNVSGVPGLSAEILGPPRDTTFFSRMQPPSHQRFLTAPDDEVTPIRPFPRLEMKAADADLKELVEKQAQPVLPDEDTLALREAAEAPADRLALVLDNARNNSSLVILFRYGGRSLLFGGDAQWGNWQSWIGTERARELLSEVDFIKIAHHGSHNATPVDVVKALRPKELAVMISTQAEPFPTIPRPPLLAQLEQRATGNAIMRSDWVRIENAPEGPEAKALPQCEVRALCVEYSL
ncbi:MAG TPA: MBL fold metallo-hydrolase [Thermoanaerobaculia bacterium]|nr:MBL fold metallo-hydrolase [Thermoanaerobaculia bacterium]